MPPFGFCGPSNAAQALSWDCQVAWDCYLEKQEVPGTKTPIALLLRPGKKVYASLAGELSVPCLFTVNGRTFAAASNLWEVSQGGAVHNWGSIGTAPLQPPQMTANQTQLVILNNGNLYVFTLANNTLQAVNMAQFNGPISQIDFVDGYIIATLQNSHTFQQSNLGDATTWSGLNISTISYFPDNITSMKVDHRALWFFSAKKAIGYYNAGAGFPVFIPDQSKFLETGSGATFATVQLDNSILWLDQDERGSMVARRMNGSVGERISTHAVEGAWQKYAVNSDAVGWTYQEFGHSFWVIYFHTANKTWVYDVASGYWHNRGYWNEQSGTHSADRAMSHTFNFGVHLVGDWATGTIYQMSSSFYDDAGNPIRWFRRAPIISKEKERIFFSEIVFDLDMGLGPSPPLLDGDGQPRPPQAILRWSNDYARTWSSDYLLSAGFSGEFGLRMIKRMLGKGRERVFELSGSDPIPWRFADAYVKSDPEIE